MASSQATHWPSVERMGGPSLSERLAGGSSGVIEARLCSCVPGTSHQDCLRSLLLYLCTIARTPETTEVMSIMKSAPGVNFGCGRLTGASRHPGIVNTA